MLTCFWKKNYPAESCMSSLVTSSEHNFELNFAMLNNKTHVFSWKEKALSVNRLHSIHSSTYEKATHKRQIKWKCFCTFGVRFLWVFSTSSPAILKNCIMRIQLRLPAQNSAKTLLSPSDHLVQWMVWLNWGKNMQILALEVIKKGQINKSGIVHNIDSQTKGLPIYYGFHM